MAESDPMRHVLTITEHPPGKITLDYTRHRGEYPQPWTRETTQHHTLRHFRARLIQLAYRLADTLAEESATPRGNLDAISDALATGDRELLCGCRYNTIDASKVQACAQHQAAAPAAG